MTHNRLLPALLALVASSVACSDSTQPSDSASPTPADAPDIRSAAQGQPGPLALGRSVRGFGGFFLDANGAPTVYLTSENERGNASKALEPWLRAHGKSGQLQVKQGKFEWTQLEKWFAKASPTAFGIRGTVFVDADEAANRIRVAVEPGTAKEQLRAALVQAGIPAEAVLISESEPIRQLATLRDAVRPTVGGLQINFDPDPAAPGSFACTLGFNVIAGGVRSFITNSHCTNEQGGVEGTVYGQPLLSSGVIATEVADPEYFRGRDCYPSFVCRFSDASRAAYASGTESRLGRIARTPQPNNTGSNQLTIAGDFTITGEDLSTNFVIGAVLNRVGRTSGWTRGPVVNTCVDVLASGTRFVQLCQTLVQAASAGGDSGSPVFAQQGGGNVTLAGIHWGGGGGVFVFSPLANIERELGPLTTH